MKKIISLCFTLISLVTFSFAQQNSIKPAKAGVTYGKNINQKDAISTQALEGKLLNNKSFTGKVKGQVTEVCKMSGCYLMLGITNSKTVTVRFKDGAFKVPSDLNGKTVVLEGTVTQKNADDLNMIADGILVVK